MEVDLTLTRYYQFLLLLGEIVYIEYGSILCEKEEPQTVSLNLCYLYLILWSVKCVLTISRTEGNYNSISNFRKDCQKLLEIFIVHHFPQVYYDFVVFQCVDLIKSLKCLLEKFFKPLGVHLESLPLCIFCCTSNIIWNYL